MNNKKLEIIDTRKVEMVHFHKTEILQKAPEISGVYFLFSKRGKLVYLGKALNLKCRLSQHANLYYHAELWATKKIKRVPHNIRFAKPFEYFCFLCLDEELISKEEKKLIEKYKPRYNGVTLFNV